MLRKNNFPIVDENPTARYKYPMTIVKSVLLFTIEILTGYASQIIRSLRADVRSHGIRFRNVMNILESELPEAPT